MSIKEQIENNDDMPFGKLDVNKLSKILVDLGVVKDSKYYTPTIEEFHVGFEFEVEEDVGFMTGKYHWVAGHLETDKHFQARNWEFINDSIKQNKVRVKYLDSKDIESLGWRLKVKTQEGTYPQQYRFYKATAPLLRFYDVDSYDECNIEIYNLKFIVKNKSELKVLLKQLSIL